ncbi:pectate lyase superfamily protein-domain-containing protein [Aspergillus filifer]
MRENCWTSPPPQQGKEGALSRTSWLRNLAIRAQSISQVLSFAAHAVKSGMSLISVRCSAVPVPAASPHPSSDLSAATVKVIKALEVLAIANKLRVENAKANNYTFASPDQVAGRRMNAPPLEYSEEIISQLLSDKRVRTRDDSHLTGELAEAARMLAESSPPSPSTGEHAALAAKVHTKYRSKTIDTNRPPQKLQRPNGLFEHVPRIAEQTVMDSSAKRDSQETAIFKRRSESSFAPDGYKVWRNVKDYGAKAAINKAMSDANRCGADCGSSTVYPAAVFFRPGTYLFLGDPNDYPTILAASSFVGLGFITSDVYIKDQEQWYVALKCMSTPNNFLRHVRNFKLDITRTDPNAYVCAIYWQVAQGTTLENIEFYMSTAKGATQQGLYMENGSGGFMGNLMFVGGNFGAYLGNQQFTARQLAYVNCKTAVHIHWDWAWTMQDVVIESCGLELSLLAGDQEGGKQGVGSYILVDALIANTPTGILTSVYGQNSTAVMLQNVGFFNVQDAIVAESWQNPILAGGNEVMVDSWDLTFIPRTEDLTGSESYAPGTYNYFAQRRPQYNNLGATEVLDVRAYGAEGDGRGDDTAVLNNVLSLAANISATVYFPYEVYTIKDTLHVSVGSRILGDVGILEMQNMMFTVSGPTAGAVLMEWNVHESFQGSAGLWDSHIRVGGVAGPKFQAADCPKQSSPLKDRCIAASALLHITRSASAYMENIWAWTADHDLDIKSQDQLDVFTGRGILIESQGPTWLYGNSSEHNVLYQYQLSGARNVVMGMIQTQSPYFQPTPPAPKPLGKSIGGFANDPDMTIYKATDKTCGSSWGVRIVDSESIYMLGAAPTRKTVETNDCQQRAFEVQQSSNVWIVNLVTKAILESISPFGEIATWAQDSRNGYTSSLLGWFREGKMIGKHNFTGFVLSSCRTSMTQSIDCHDDTYLLQGQIWKGGFDNDTLSDLITQFVRNCDTEKERELIPTRLGGQLCAGWNETCLKDPETDRYCGDDIDNFTVVSHINKMPKDELCSFCYHTLTNDAAGDTCDSIALQFNVASASLFMGNDNLLNCFPSREGTALCIPFACDGVYNLQDGDTCTSIGKDLGIPYSHGSTIRQYNPWINYDCSNLHDASDVAYGHPGNADGYAIPEIPPTEDVPVADGTTYRCGKWHVVTNEDVRRHVQPSVFRILFRGTCFIY